jgi:hypothetical protein
MLCTEEKGMNERLRQYIECNKAACQKLAEEAAAEYERAEDRVARQHWVGQELYWKQRVDHWTRRQEEEDRYAR